MANEEYLDKSQRDSFKPALMAYLRQKAARRAAVTSPQAYQTAEGEFLKDKVYQDAGALVGAASTGASMAGTLGGKRSEASIIPTFMDAQRQNSNDLVDRELKLRGLEEKSLGTDLDIGKTIAEGDEAQSRRKLAREQLGQNLEDKRQQRAMDQQRISETGRHNQAMEGLYGKGRGPGHTAAAPEPNWIIKEGQDGLIQINPKTGQSRPVAPGFKPTQKPAGAAASPYAKERAPGAKLGDEFDASYAKKSGIANTQEAELKKLRQLIDSGQESVAMSHAQGMVKGLNAAFGSDAVGAEESARLGSNLEVVRNPMKPGVNLGNMFGVQLEEFYKQANAKAQSMRSSAESDRAMGLQHRSGQTPPQPREDPKNTQQPWMGDQGDGRLQVQIRDPKVESFATERGITYEQAKTILQKRGTIK